MVILFTVLWHCTMMPLPERTYTQQNWSWTPHLSRKFLNELLRKAMSLSGKISACGLYWQNFAFNWLITLAMSCRWRHLKMVNQVGPQLINVKKMGALMMSNINHYPVPCLFNIQGTLWSMHWWQVNWLTLLTFPVNTSHSHLGLKGQSASQSSASAPH